MTLSLKAIDFSTTRSRVTVAVIAAVSVVAAVAIYSVLGYEGEKLNHKRLADYSWKELKFIAIEIAGASTDDEAIEIAKSYGLVDSSGLLCGDEKSLTLSDGREASVRIVGFRHDTRTHGDGKAGITFEFSDIPKAHRIDGTYESTASIYDNTYGTYDSYESWGEGYDSWSSEPNDPIEWATSDMRTWLNGSFFEQLPNSVRTRVVTVEKCTNGASDAPVGDSRVATVTGDKVWLFSMAEIYGDLLDKQNNVPADAYIYNIEGEQYQYYADQGVSPEDYSPCMKGGAESWWWLRSQALGFSDYYFCITSDGDWILDTAGTRWGVSPGFCF